VTESTSALLLSTVSPITTPKESISNARDDEIIQGQSFKYTRAEAKLYENEEPCDTWRHFDVFVFPNRC